MRFPKGLSGWAPFFAIGLLNNVLPFSLIVIGQTYIPSGLASILNATTPLFTVLVMAAAGEEKLHARRIAGVVVGLIGVIILHGGRFGLGERAGAWHPALPCGRVQLRIVGAAGATAAVELAAAGTATFQMLASAVMMTVVAGSSSVRGNCRCRARRHGWP